MLLKIRLHCCIGVYADFNSQAPPPSIRRFTVQEKDTLPALHTEIEIRDEKIKMLSQDLDALKAKYDELLITVKKIRSMLENY